MSHDVKSAANAPKRRSQGRPFQPGNPGKPKGTRNKRTLLAEKLMGDDLEAVTRSVINAARNGDMTAARIVMDRLVPVRKGRPVRFDVPDAMDAAGVAEAFKRLMEAIGSGEITPEEASTIAGVLELRRKAIETVEIEARIKALEERGDE
jgi:hypothetical protein